ncbi:BSD domain-containing protein 1-like [Durio zibethinus]|uniref:BSD domain-containing protein 1-like n=1 Tax=Durio zibethinus TaxID=66656 RepID=A0A6P5ZZI8_DURZI|nr:BSD domain-containing protein 1-like [Durio zibethinus]XP_022758152.1 BSD domain-containing protein 1-like [Durio zibethinus]XP_022758153.1 BSD domain-containing protein 1-like [Durio zibethinus]
MDFFKSVFADDPDPPKPQSQPHSDSPKADDFTPDSSPKQPDPNPNPTGWSFGGLIKTIATRSESVIETYRRDLKEFGSGLKKEIEVAQGSLENVGHVIDEFGNTVIKGTAQIITQGKDAILAVDNESDSSASESNGKSLSTQRSLNSKRYSRLDAQVRAIQGDINTYSEEPEDLEDYKKWKSGFGLEEKKEEIERLMEENGEIGSIYKKVVGVSNGVDHETFWGRYFYRVFKLKRAEDTRVKLVKRAISREEEEELSWDVDEDEDERNVVWKATLKKEDVDRKEKDETVEEKAVNLGPKGDFLENKEQVEKVKEKNPVEELDSYDSNKQGKGNDDESSGGNVVTEKVNLEKNEEACKEGSVSKSVEKVVSEGKGDNEESSNGNGKDSDFSVVSSHPSMPEEDDLGWDEIEDLSSIDDKKGTHAGSPRSNRADLRKRLSTAEEEEDLSWDIEDDDEPVKA